MQYLKQQLKFNARKQFKMRKIFIYVMLLISIGSYAQQDAQYTQYMYNTMSVNPAYAGSRGALSITGIYRTQWVGLDGAPKTQSLNLHSPISERIGLGLSVINDEIGPTNETNIDATFSYNIRTSAYGNLAFGLKAGLHLLNVDFNELSNFEAEPNTMNNVDNKVSPNVGAGVYYYTDRFYAGLSVPNLIETEHFDESSVSVAKEKINLYVMSGYVFRLDPAWQLKPAALIKLVEGAPLQVDISANLWYNERFSLGAAYRLDSAVSLMAGFQFNDQIMLGFAYDKETTELGNTSYNDGSFEFLLRFELFNRYRRLLSPRFF